MASSVDGGAVATETVGQETGDSPNCGNADARQIVNLPVGQVLFEVLHHLPAINQRLQLSRGAQILKEIAALIGGPKADNGLEQGIFGNFLLTLGFVAVGLHGEPMY